MKNHIAACTDKPVDGEIKLPTLRQMRLKLYQVRTRLTKEQRKALNRDVLRLVVGTNLPFSWVDNPIVRAFAVKWLGVAFPSRNTLAYSLLPAELARLDEAVRKTTEGKKATLMCDGWNNVRGQHLLAFVLIVKGTVRRSGSE